jgi:hypothetical protein
MDPNRRFLTLVLALGTAVLLVAILVGEQMGDNVMTNAVDKGGTLASSVVVTPAPSQSPGPYGPGWSRSDALAAPPDPRFPDPRVPPVPLPTRPPATPAPTPPPSTPTPNPNIPIWRQQPLPTMSPSGQPSEGPSPSASPG